MTDLTPASVPDLTSGIDDLSILERVNPVFNTAKMTLCQLAASDNENALALSKMLGLTAEETEAATETDEKTINHVMLETRYRTMGALAKESGCPTVVDLPCGYNPRGLEFASKGRSYVGIDLPAVILEAEPAITSLLPEDQRHLIRYFGADATNYASLKKAFDQIEGEVCITTEGLLMYFTDSETAEFCDNIRKILSEHGGCWLLADAEVVMQYILTARAFYGDRFMEVMHRRKAHADKQSDVDVKARTLVIDPTADPSLAMREAMKFLAAHGLKAERLIVADHVQELNSLSMLPADKAAQIRESMKSYAYWKITPIVAVPLDASEAQGGGMKLAASLDKDTLSLTIVGRLDTLTAPNLLEFYEKTAAKHDINEIRVDCSKLAYVSSAGLRVIVIMLKGCSRGVTLVAPNDLVREILDQTGIVDMVNVE
ncbi:MAG: STAS domain-containing protein [Atopobiaceae bacterium]|nr:STAS domain-containing protein [Atopobiaceae bacterium]